MLEKSNKRFSPRVRTIRNHIVKVKNKSRYPVIDRECLIDKVEKWRYEDPNIKIYLRTKETSNPITDSSPGSAEQNEQND